MKNIMYSDKLGSRSRAPFLILIQDTTAHLFRGVTIPGVVAVRSARHIKDGKWSHTTFDLVLADDVRAISARTSWDRGSWLDGLADALGVKIQSWDDAAQALGVPVAEARRFIAEVRPGAAEHLDSLAEALASLS